VSEEEVKKLPWIYCPECGSEEIRHEEGVHKQCAVCLQEWFSDIDYTDVVAANVVKP
jgi:NADH pyrophosphatase NudC (nudix superfamily)